MKCVALEGVTIGRFGLYQHSVRKERPGAMNSIINITELQVVPITTCSY